jgi:predicted transcriptional regulator
VAMIIALYDAREPIERIANRTGISKRTVKKYVRARYGVIRMARRGNDRGERRSTGTA